MIDYTVITNMIKEIILIVTNGLLFAKLMFSYLQSITKETYKSTGIIYLWQNFLKAGMTCFTGSKNFIKAPSIR